MPTHSTLLQAELIREATPEDAVAVADIYNEYIAKSVATFEVDPVSVADMRDRISDVQHRYPWLVSEHHGEIIGYAYATAWKSRAAYARTVETTIYLSAAHTGRGAGLPLYQTLIQILHQQKMHCAIGGIALPNMASIRLHERLGFQKVAHFQQVGYKFGQWVDVGYWELIL